MYALQKPLTSAIRLILGTSMATSALTAVAVEAEEPVINEIEVRALGVQEAAEHIASSFSIIDAEALLKKGGSTLGDALKEQPGVHSDTFGGGASRPVIRGQTAPRVSVLSDGSSMMDASSVSPDHAVTADPLLARKIEVLRGPASLLYGGAAIGGVVNVVDNKIAETLPEKDVEGFVALQGGTVASDKSGVVSVTGQAFSNLVFHLEGSRREANDYEVEDWDESHVEGSWADSDNYSAGLSWVGDRGFLGMAYSYRQDNYGLPGHEHEYEECHPHDDHIHCGSHDDHDHDDHDHDEEHDHGAPVVDLASRRVDLRGEIFNPMAGIESIRLRAAHTDYRHHEIEEGEISTTFANKGYEVRLEARHAPIGDWQGVVGIQHQNSDFGADGAEAFIPNVDIESTAIFVVEHIEASDQWHIELGGRYEHQKLSPKNDSRDRPSRSDDAFSLSAAAIWEFQPDYSLTFAAAHSERLPQAQELYARGIHLATNTYECGLLSNQYTCGGAENDQSSETETSRNLEVTLKKIAGDVTFSVGVFHNDIDDYIYARTLDRHEDFRLIKYTQRDATFNGGEAEVTYRFNDNWSATLFGDVVRAKVDGDGDLPRISPARFGTRVNAQFNRIEGELDFYRVARQNDVADYEEKTPGYNMLNVTMSYQPLADGRLTLFVRGNNLLDEKVWNHTSYLANTVPLPGMNLSAGLKYSF